MRDPARAEGEVKHRDANAGVPQVEGSPPDEGSGVYKAAPIILPEITLEQAFAPKPFSKLNTGAV